jgi:hypothetical protein
MLYLVFGNCLQLSRPLLYCKLYPYLSSIPDSVIGIFHCHNPSVRLMALGLAQSVTEMSARNISWGVKAAGV